jgi:site-specific DNA-methyltransferase (adenine-specific)
MKIREGIHLFNGDCLEVMKKLPSNSIDLILADPPYEQNVRLKWDKMIDFESLWVELGRIAKDKAPIVLMGNQPFTTDLINSKRDWFRYEWVWDKHIPRGMHQAKSQPMRKHENVIVFSKNYPTNYFPIMEERDKPIKRKNYNKNSKGIDGHYKEDQTDKWFEYTHKNPNTIITGCWEKNKGKVHPTQKPVSLMEYLIKTYTKENDLVLDFCFGSNSCGVAALNTNRKYIGIERDKNYFEQGKERIITHLSSTSDDNSSVS